MQLGEQIQFEIEDAFAGVACPALDEIAYEDDWEHDVVTKVVGAYVGSTLPDQVLRDHPGSLSAMMPTAFVYFLPAYLNYGLRHPDSEVMDIVLSNLCSASRSSAKYWRDRVSLLTTAQRQALCAFMKFAAAQHLRCLSTEEFERTREFWCSGR